MMSNCPVDDVRVGMAVEAYALPAELADGERIGVPLWRPVVGPPAG